MSPNRNQLNTAILHICLHLARLPWDKVTLLGLARQLEGVADYQKKRDKKFVIPILIRDPESSKSGCAAKPTDPGSNPR